jgi:predicted short-subunit dehydrogenase-like oxidoreductase (DUF2520 family)
MIKVVLLGAGNVAVHLAAALQSAKNVALIQRFSRNDKMNGFFDANIPFTTKLDELQKADVYIIAINDDAIESFSKKLPPLEGLVVHTSGSMPMMAIDRSLRKGVLYPVQTFSKGQAIDFSSVPLAIEAELDEDQTLLNQLATSLSDKVFQVRSSQREKLHLAAVFANNFSNYMYLMAQDICDENLISFDILKPIILETAKKIMNLDPYMAQTGPAKRKDIKVIEKHLLSLEGEKKEIYGMLSNAISKRYQS